MAAARCSPPTSAATRCVDGLASKHELTTEHRRIVLAMADTQLQRFNPVLRYDDGEKAMTFLEEAFGFEPGPVHRSPDGVIVHAEMALGGQYIGLSERAKSEQTIFDLGPCVVYVVLDDEIGRAACREW